MVQEVYEQQKELILLGERVVLATLGFDLNVHHPYKPLVEAIKKFKVAQNALAQVAWNFVNDGYDITPFLLCSIAFFCTILKLGCGVQTSDISVFAIYAPSHCSWSHISCCQIPQGEASIRW